MTHGPPEPANPRERTRRMSTGGKHEKRWRHQTNKSVRGRSRRDREGECCSCRRRPDGTVVVNNRTGVVHWEDGWSCLQHWTSTLWPKAGEQSTPGTQSRTPPAFSITGQQQRAADKEGDPKRHPQTKNESSMKPGAVAGLLRGTRNWRSGKRRGHGRHRRTERTGRSLHPSIPSSPRKGRPCGPNGIVRAG